MILVTTIHDPNQKLINDILKKTDTINNLFDEVYLCISDKTDSNVIEVCCKNFYRVKVIKKNGAADARRNVLRYACSYYNNAEAIMYCDFDRLLTWINRYPNELVNVINNYSKKNKWDYIILGRTLEAFSSHPNSWKETENITNKIASFYFGKDNLDITAGASIMNFESANYIINQSMHSHTDCEWPMITMNSGGLIGEIKVNGLAYDDINTINNSSKLEDELMARLNLSLKIVSVFIK